MAKYSSADVGFLLIDGYDILGTSTQLSDSREARTDETTALGDTAESHEFTKLTGAEISQEGFFDDDSDSSHDALNAGLGEKQILCYGLEGNTIGKKFVGYLGALQTTYNKIASRGELHRANASYLGSGDIEEGVILHTHTSRTADGNTESTSVDNSAQTTAGASAYLQISELTLDTHTNITITIRESADDENWSDLESFTAVTSAPGKERIEISGTVKRYLAVKWEFTGAAGSPSAKFMVGISRN